MNSKIMKYVVAIFAQFLLVIASSCASTYRVYSTSEAQFISKEKAFDEIAKADVVVVGETHYDKVVQITEGQVLQELSKRNPTFQMAWEFLNFEDQNQLQTTFDEFVSGKISAQDWITRWFPNNSANHQIYIPMFEVAKQYSQRIIGTNASRTLKRRLMDGGRVVIDSDREVWPFNHALSEAPKEYLERFKLVMGGHADSQTIEKYYLAQFYTDAHMAGAIESKLIDGPVMMVVGHFHSDYGHGLPFYLNDFGVKNLLNLKIVNATGLSEEEIGREVKPHAQYGAVGDYILVAQ